MPKSGPRAPAGMHVAKLPYLVAFMAAVPILAAVFAAIFTPR